MVHVVMVHMVVVVPTRRCVVRRRGRQLRALSWADVGIRARVWLRAIRCMWRLLLLLLLLWLLLLWLLDYIVHLLLHLLLLLLLLLLPK